ncbi:3671_t:CDS:2, partial [Dentiscutata erythropus]
ENINAERLEKRQGPPGPNSILRPSAAGAHTQYTRVILMKGFQPVSLQVILNALHQMADEFIPLPSGANSSNVKYTTYIATYTEYIAGHSETLTVTDADGDPTPSVMSYDPSTIIIIRRVTAALLAQETESSKFSTNDVTPGLWDDSFDWMGEEYEKSRLPRGVDKAFRKFSDRVSEWPDQCIRYEFDGQPLLYNQSDSTVSLLLSPPHGSVKQLKTREYAANSSEKKSGIEGNKCGIAQFDVGMEWGTVMIFTCQKDCEIYNVSKDEVSYYEELVLVQYEL